MRIGGEDAGDLNRISGNGLSGIAINGFSIADPAEGSFGNLIQGNRIGTSGNGQAAVPNGGAGISLLANTSDSEIIDNVISANGGDGISMSTLVNAAEGAPGPSDNVVAGNLIGTDIDGDTDLGNGGVGVRLSSNFSANVIGGNVIGGYSGATCGADCNTIAGNGQHGIRIVGAATGNEVVGNLIGVDASGVGALGNGFGVSLEETSEIVPTANRIGAPDAGNVIADNGGTAGIWLSEAEGTIVQGNLIGTAADGLTPYPNGGDGIALGGGAHDSMIGGTASAERNLILFADGHGVAVREGTENSILGNLINVSSGLGIDLEGGSEDAFGVTANDPLDADGGSNDLQNYPEIDVAVAGSSTTVVGALESEPETGYRVEVFSTNVPDPSGFGEGRSLLGAFELTTDAAGWAEFTRVLAWPSSVGEVITATATRLSPGGAPRSTSEFSEAVAAGECDVTGTEGDDVLAGTAADEVICGYGGDDVIAPGGGDDLVVGGAGTDQLTLSAAPAAVELDLGSGEGTVGADRLRVLEVEDVTGSAFADTIAGDGGQNFLDGGSGADTLEGGAGGDTLEGGAGADTLRGDEGADTLRGEDGADTLNGGTGGDSLLGGGGNDTLKGGDAADTLKGQDGGDTLNGNDGADSLLGGSGKDTLRGKAGADTIKGQDGADKLRGGDGGDDLRGGAGNDDLDGNGGRDELNGGGGGGDDCDGGKGRDRTPASGCEKRRSIP